MTENEENAIELLEYIKNNSWTTLYIMSTNSKDAETLINLIQTQQEKIEYYKKQKDYDDQFKHELLEEIRCKSLVVDSLNKVLSESEE